MTIPDRSRIKFATPSFEVFFFGHFFHDFAVVDHALFVFAHQYEIPIGYFMEHLSVCEVKRLHESGDLPEHSIITYDFCFAVRLATLLAKVDSLIKDFTEMREYADSRADTISSTLA